MFTLCDFNHTRSEKAFGASGIILRESMLKPSLRLLHKGLNELFPKPKSYIVYHCTLCDFIHPFIEKWA